MRADKLGCAFSDLARAKSLNHKARRPRLSPSALGGSWLISGDRAALVKGLWSTQLCAYEGVSSAREEATDGVAPNVRQHQPVHSSPDQGEVPIRCGIEGQ